MPRPYHGCMRTTISIDDRLLEEAKHRASESRQTLGQFVEDAVRRRLAEQDSRPPAPEIPVFSRGKGLRPGVDASSNAALLDLLDEP